jgi:carbonic anhydrase/acetyltransferase-like protein (isoleucine patch superfamily)
MPIYALDGFRPELPPDGDFWIAPDAVVIGKVRLGKGASIWWGAVLRGDNDWISIGENSNVQDLSVIHTDSGEPVEIGARVTVGHRVIIHSAQVGEESLIGMGSILLNRARIGRHCLVGAGALVTEDKQFGDSELILGSPARAVKKVSEEQIARFRKSAAGYVANGRRYRERLEGPF